MQTKVKIILAALALVVVASPVSANITLSDSKVIAGQEFTVTCASSAGYYSVFRNSTFENITSGTCTDSPVDENLSDVGNFVIMELDSNETVYVNALAATVSDTETVQVTPDFSDPDVSQTVTAGSFTGFLGGIGSFLVAQLPAVLATLAALIGLGFLLTRVRRWIGKKA